MYMKSPFKSVAIALAAVGIVSFLLSCSGSHKEPVKPLSLVNTSNGTVQGAINSDGSVAAFKGIPFAAPPVGNLRWREPQPAASWEGIRDASEFCTSCMQNRVFTQLPKAPWSEEFMVQDSVSEDCLYLNIWTPATTPGDSLAVLVFIHGGAFTEGSGSIAVYDGEELAKKGIIVVNVNYRLGVFGFFTHPELTAETANKASGNYALLDCIAALKWITNNITAFGGDPSRVTISGQSAGAAMVHALTASPQAKDLFSGAMAISGSSLGRFNARLLADAEKSGVEFAAQKGVKDLSALRQLDAAALIAKGAGNNPIRFGIVADGYVLPENLKDIFEKGKQNDVPTLTGITADDAGALNRKITRKEFAENAKRTFGAKAGTFLALYPAATDEEAASNAIQTARDMNKMETYKWAAFRAKTATTPVYTYYFDRAIPWPEHPEFGAFHSGDLPYYFLNLQRFNRPWTSVDTLVAETVSSYWVNFVKTGNPNGAGLPEWTAFDPEKKITFRLGEQPEAMPLTDEKKIEFYLGL